MKYTLIAAMLFSNIIADAQTKLVPANNVVDKKWLTNQKYEMIWYTIRDTTKFEIGKFATEISNTGDKITVITQITMKRGSGLWIDSTVASAKDLQPIYHSSYNVQRDMVLNFGKVVTGYYNNKTNKTTINISDTTKEAYFDSNIYPTLLAWLPFKEGYKQDIAIYDYNPGGKIGIIKASVQDVKKGTWKSEISGVHDVWIVTVADEIGGGDSKSVYYIDITDRKLWKQEVDAAGRKMMMLRAEN